MSRRLLDLLLLTLVYALMLGSFQPWDLATGAVVGAALLLGLRRFLYGDGSAGPPGRPEPPGVARRLLAFPAFAWAVSRDILRGTWQVARTVLSPRLPIRPGIIGVPMGDRTAAGVAVTSLAVTLSPGSFLVEVDDERRILWFHVLDASDPARERQRIQDLYRRWQRHVFP